MRQSSLLCLALLCCTISAVGESLPVAEPEWGELPMRHFTAREYGAHAQSFDLVQNVDGHVYVANGLGILSYDGTRWQLFPTENRTGCLSLAASEDGVIHVGAQGEIGYLAADEVGQLQFVSLNDRLPEAHREFGDVWYTEANSDGVYFISREALMHYADGAMHIIEPRDHFPRAFMVDEALIVQDGNHGLFRLAAGKLEFVEGSDKVAAETINVVLAEGDGLLLCGRESLCNVLHNSKLTPWPTAIDQRLGSEGLYRGVRLRDGRVVLLTLTGGFYLLDESGTLIQQFNPDYGFPTTTVYHAFEDHLGGLWLTTDRGIVRAGLSSAISHFDRNRGLEGMVLGVHRHRGRLYVSTGTGAFQLVEGHLHQLPEITGPTWEMISFDQQLLIASELGVFRVDNDEPELIRPALERAVNSLLRSGQQPERVFVGSVGGLASLRFRDGRWVDEGAIPGISEQSRMLLEDDEGRLWIGTQYQSVLRVTFPPDWDGADSGQPEVERFGQDHGLPSAFNINLYRIDDEILFSSVATGVFRFEQETRRFVPDQRFARAMGIDEFTINPMAQDSSGHIWVDLGELKGFLQPSGNGGFSWHTTSLAPVHEETVYVIYPDVEGIVWMGGADGLIRFDSRVEREYQQVFPARIRRVEVAGERLIFGGVALPEPPILEWQSNALRFEFSAPAFDYLEANRYQIRLDGLDDDWSAWSNEVYRDYTNLREGDYRFRVRARNAYAAISEEAEFRFSVLPPPYRSWWAYLLYTLALITLLWLFQRWRTRRLQAHNLALEATVNQRTVELASKHQELEKAYESLAEISVTDQLTGLKNRHFLTMHLDADAERAQRQYADWRRAGGPRPSQADLVFFLVDLDWFKTINDRYGHTVGDRVLVRIGEVLTREFREADFVVRWGGEEFLAVARFVDRDQAPAMAERVRGAIAAERFEVDETTTLELTCSIGFACYPFLPEQPERLNWMQVVDIADCCMYVAKRERRNHWVGVFAGPEFVDTEQLLTPETDGQRLLDIPGLKVVRSDHRY